VSPSVAVKLFSHLIYIIKTFYKLYTFNAIYKYNAAIKSIIEIFIPVNFDGSYFASMHIKITQISFVHFNLYVFFMRRGDLRF
jgi:hypothetical protein